MQWKPVTPPDLRKLKLTGLNQFGPGKPGGITGFPSIRISPGQTLSPEPKHILLCFGSENEIICPVADSNAEKTCNSARLTWPKLTNS